MRAFLGAVSTVVLAFTVACSQTDAGITTAVKSKLAADDMIKAYKVDVDTQNKVVTLNGEVETTAQREHAVMIARGTKGVADVIDQLRVNPTAATSGVEVGVSGVDRFEGDVKSGAEKTGHAVERGAERTGHAIERGAEKTGNVIERGAEKTGHAIERGAEKTKEGAKKVGGEIKDVFTDDDRDSDKDGK